MEIWKDIKDYEGIYKISNLGNIKSFKHNKEKIIALTPDKDGYLKAKLYKKNKPKVVYAHKIVAQTFLKNPKNYNIVNHKDENKQNNRVNNLEFCDSKYNNNYGSRKYKNNRKEYINKALSLLKTIEQKDIVIEQVINILDKIK